MKPFAWGALALALPLGTLAARAEDPAPATRTFRFRYAASVTAPEGARRLDVWVPLPLEDDLQTVSDLKVAATAGGEPVEPARGKDATYGNPMAHVGVDAPAGVVRLEWSATIVRAVDRGQGKGPVLARFSQEDRLVPRGGKAAALAKELGVDGEGDARARARRIYDHVLATMVYDKQTPGWGLGDFARACEVGKGNCTDFHAKFIGIGREAGIPVRFTMGVPLGREPKGTAGGYHCWGHFHDGTSWVPVDISEAQKVQASDPERAAWFFGHLDADRVALSVGRDVTLVPAQKGDAVMFFAYPYAEADGKPLELPKESRSFTWE